VTALRGGVEQIVIEPDEVDQAALPGAEHRQIRRYGRLDLIVVHVTFGDRMQPRQTQRPQVAGSQLGADTDDRPEAAVAILVEEVAIAVAADRDDDISAGGPRRRRIGEAVRDDDVRWSTLTGSRSIT
jgi:hypothetical protein